LTLNVCHLRTGGGNNQEKLEKIVEKTGELKKVSGLMRGI
jgi:hypothetical protein